MAPAKATAKKQRSKKVSAAPTSPKARPIRLTPAASLALAALAGAFLGFSAPGFDHWYLAWFGLVPLFLLAVSSRAAVPAFLHGTAFGVGYNLVYLNWYFHLHPLDWLGFSSWQSVLVALAAWFVVSMHQGLIIGIFCFVAKLLPLTGGIVPKHVDKRICLPATLVLPLLWVLFNNKLLNAPDLLGVPWSMIEYSQYKQLALLQITSWIGGIGLSWLIATANVAIASTIATFSQSFNWKPLAMPTNASALTQLLSVALLVASATIWGMTRLYAPEYGQSETLSVLQGNINIEMQKTSHHYTLSDLLQMYEPLARKAPAGIVVWTESSLPTYLRESHTALSAVTALAHERQQDMILGSMDHSADSKPYNSAFGVCADGTLLNNVYHKRYLVPFGEYMPHWVRYMPEWMQRLTSTPAGSGFQAGNRPVVLDFGSKHIAPLICFETLSPELTTSSVRNGGDLLVNLSDLAWFHESMIGQQMVAFSVMRAVESGRYFVFAANTGPSVIIDTRGRVAAHSPLGRPAVMTGHVRFSSERTPFTQWFN